MSSRVDVWELDLQDLTVEIICDLLHKEQRAIDKFISDLVSEGKPTESKVMKEAVRRKQKVEEANEDVQRQKRLMLDHLKNSG